MIVMPVDAVATLATSAAWSSPEIDCDEILLFPRDQILMLNLDNSPTELYF